MRAKKPIAASSRRAFLLTGAAISTLREVAAAPATNPETEARVATILRKYGSRLSTEQRADIQRLTAQTVATSELMAAFPLENSDEPALIFHPDVARGF